MARTLAAASLAGAACYLVHLSSAGSVDQVRLARRRGQRGVFAEVCPHHLLLDDTRYAGADAGRYLVARRCGTAAHVEALWEGLADGTIDTVGSDHCQVRSADPGPWRRPATATPTGWRASAPGCRCCCPRRLRRGVPIERVVQASGGKPGPRVRPLPGEGRARAGF